MQVLFVFVSLSTVRQYKCTCMREWCAKTLNKFSRDIVVCFAEMPSSNQFAYISYFGCSPAMTYIVVNFM